MDNKKNYDDLIRMEILKNWHQNKIIIDQYWFMTLQQNEGLNILLRHIEEEQRLRNEKIFFSKLTLYIGYSESDIPFHTIDEMRSKVEIEMATTKKVKNRNYSRHKSDKDYDRNDKRWKKWIK